MLILKRYNNKHITIEMYKSASEKLKYLWSNISQLE